MNQNDISLEKVIYALSTCSLVQCGAQDHVYICPVCLYGRSDGSPCESLHPLLDDALALLKKLSAFKEYFDGLYGQGLEVANWHMNGSLEPFDSFYDSAMEASEHD